MFLSLNWLKDFVDVPRSIAPEELGRLLTLHTVEVEKTERQSDKYKNVVVGKILEIKPHPNADKLRLALVDIGRDKLEVVCGAPNIEVGQLVPVALVGAVLPNGMEIKPAEIRGVKSNGMLCAEDELGLGEDHNGIIILKGAKVGQSFADYLKLDDVVFEVDNKSITHRADLWSHYGMARDISAFLDCKFNEYKPEIKILKPKKTEFKINVKVEDFKLCSRYMAIGLAGVKVEESPQWLKARLLAVGMRPINNIVDVTNYVMLELGQPLHAFDKNFIDKIIIRRAKSGEVIETLDEEKRKLEPDMLVIANAKTPVAVAGVMGGADSGINEKTTEIIIESANFDFNFIRKTAQKLALRTESSMRFEKGLDPNLTELGLARAVELILKLCPGSRVAANLVDEKKFKLNQGPIDFSLAWLNDRIGEEFSVKQVKKILEKLGFNIKEKNNNFSVTIPTWRAVRDIKIAEDVVEEIARVYGYNNIKPVMPKVAIAQPNLNQEKIIERKIKNILSLGAGMCETYNYSFVNEEQIKKIHFNLAETVKLANPLNDDMTLLRPSLEIGLLENIKNNQANEERVALYEIGGIFLNRPDTDTGLLFQEKQLAMIFAENGEVDLFRKIKGMIEYLADELNLKIKFEPDKYGAKIFANNLEIGWAGEIAKTTSQAFGVKKDAAYAEISLNKLYNVAKNNQIKQYEEPAKFPPAIRDLAFVVKEEILYNNIKELIINFSDLIKQAELFDVYQGDKLGAGKKSLAFHIIYQADKTLISGEVDEVQDKLIKHLEKEIGAKIRDF